MLTVLIATRNRARILHDVLESYCHLQQPPLGWKLIVVDNGSTDHTAQVLASFANRLPLHSACEPRLGKNHALNTGLEFVEGDLAVFTDDDAFPHADWLVQLRDAADIHLAHSVFGGAVVPRWEVPPPTWIEWVATGPVYSVTDPSLKDGPVGPYSIFGPNMAIRASVFQSGIRFDSSIGPCGSSYPMGSETELLLRLCDQRHKAWHVHGAVVEHLVRAEQMDEAWVMQRAIRFGRGRQRISPEPKLWMGIPRRLFLDIPKAGLRMAAARMLLQRETFFRSRWYFNYFCGHAIEARILARERRARAQSCPEVLEKDPRVSP